MKKWTERELIAEGYEIRNAQIKSASLRIDSDYRCLDLSIVLEGEGWGVVYGGYCLGKAYTSSDYSKDKFEGCSQGVEAIMRIMTIAGVNKLEDMTGKYVRVALGSLGDDVKIIGNILQDNWFDYGTFFENETKDGGTQNESV